MINNQKESDERTFHQKNENKSNIFKKIIPGILISIVIIAILLWKTDFHVLAKTFKNASLKLILVVFVLQSVAFVFRGLAWRIILEKLPTKVQCFWTIAEGYLLNLLPLRLGEIGRAVIMGNIIKKSAFYVFSTVILERLFDVIVTLLMLIGTIPLLAGAEFSSRSYYILFTIIIICFVLLVIIVKHKDKFINLLSKIFRPETKAGSFIISKTESLLSGMNILLEPKKLVIWLIWILLTWACWIFTFIFEMKTFFPELPLWASFFTQSLGALGGAIPSAPAGIGVIEGAYVVALRFFGIGQSEALAFGLFSHGMGIITPVIWGIIGFTIQGQNIMEVFKNIQKTDLSQEDKKNE